MKKNAIIVITLLAGVLLFNASCKKETGSPLSTNGNYPEKGKNKKEGKKLYVSTLDELYTAVNDPASSGTLVVLSPGTYVLDASYPNGGRLELQTDMGLQGQAGQPGAVIIDESQLPASSFVIPAGRTGGMRMGKGTNSLEWLSLIGGAVGANPFSVINTDLLSAETSIEISHVNVNVNGCNIGINLRNRLAEHAGRKIYAELKDSEISGAVNFNGFALAAQNANGASGSLIRLDMQGNYIHGNKVGILAFSSAQTSSVSNSTIEIVSHADRIEGNGVGIDPSAGVNQASTTVANNNTTTIVMHGSSIRDNNPPAAPQLQPVNGAIPGGIYAACAFNSVNSAAGYNRASNNTMRLTFYGCDISNNNGLDINAVAAWCPAATLLAGSNNLLEIFLHGLSANATVDAIASVPVEVAGTNVVTVIR
ncbi:MAG TPA: hypothetical protein VFI06_11205 [Chitinophagaceae bacterium]|nr:hypothetical protein [Chitinophagaceae bacterium]